MWPRVDRLLNGASVLWALSGCLWPSGAGLIGAEKEADAGPARGEDATDQAPAPYRPPEPSDPQVVRFIAMGDGGTGDATQYEVARAVRRVCEQQGCDLVLYLGDNIYEIGVQGADDPQFEHKFEAPYADLDLPFFVVLGNHDYGGGYPVVTGPDAERKSAAQIEYTARSAMWNMPARYYTFTQGPVQFFAMDTSRFVYSPYDADEAQQRWLEQELSRSTAPWKIAFGHHPYIANGMHGNAGNYAGLVPVPGMFGPDGDRFRQLVEHTLCGKVQLYLAGHDHHREWLEPVCGTHFIVSGAAAKLRAIDNRNAQPARFQDGTRNGFLWAEVTPTTLTGMFFDEKANLDYEDVVTLSEAPSM